MDKCKTDNCQNERQLNRKECKPCELKRKINEYERRAAKRGEITKQKDSINQPIDPKLKKRLRTYYCPENIITFAVGMR